MRCCVRHATRKIWTVVALIVALVCILLGCRPNSLSAVHPAGITRNQRPPVARKQEQVKRAQRVLDQLAGRADSPTRKPEGRVSQSARGNNHKKQSVTAVSKQDLGADSKVSKLKERCVRSWDEFLSGIHANSEPLSVVFLCGAAPGNVGAVLRSCAVLGVAGLCVLGMGRLNREDLRKAINVSQMDRKPHWDTVLVPVPPEDTADLALSKLRNAGLTIVGLTAENSWSRPLWEVDLAVPRLVLVFGKDEDDGMAFPDGAGTALDVAATIPMKPGTDDMLNLSSTVAAVAYERQRQLAVQAIT